jgi:hypothetical protein
MQTARTLILAALALLLLATAANAQYVGVTAQTFDGTQGIFTYNRACHDAHPGSRMCTSEEVMETINPPTLGSPGEVAWVRPVFQPVASSYTGPIAIDVSGIGTESAYMTCRGWRYEDHSGLALYLVTGQFTTNECTSALKVTCCIPVPEPSAALSIPSGAAMVLALAKLRGVGLGR